MTRAREAAGPLPELMFGFPAGEPAATLARLGDARGDYLWMQAYDLVFVALLAMTTLFAIALMLRKPAAPIFSTRWLFLAPVAFAGAELAENLVLALIAAEALAPSPMLAFMQQTITSLKLILAAATLALSFSFVAALGGNLQTGRSAA